MNKNTLSLSVLALSLVFSFALASHANAATYYVDVNGNDANSGLSAGSAFRTIQKARDTIRPLLSSMSSDITVYIKSGYYQLSSTLDLNSNDSGQNGHNVIYSSNPGESSPVISGGTQISGWTSVGNGIYKANVGSLRFRQFYVNGQRGIRARTPNTSSNYKTQSWDIGNKLMVINSNEISNWQRLNEVEMIITTQHEQRNLRISSFNSSGNTAYVSAMEPERSINFDKIFTNPGVDSYFFENAYEFLDSPGEFYLNTGTNELFYMPRQGENMSTASAVVPILETLISLEGAHNIAFYGLTFEYSNWNEPSNSGYIEIQGINTESNTMSSAVYGNNISNLRFERNIFINLGGIGLGFLQRSTDNVVIGNVFKDLAGTAIALNMQFSYVTPFSQRDLISNNYIKSVGLDYVGNTGIMVAFADSTRIEHNELVDVPYTGISLGWNFSYIDTGARNNSISYNRIHDVMNKTADGAGIYTAGNQSGTIIRENYIYDLVRFPWAGSYTIAGLYTDEYSSNMTLQNNIVDNVPLGLNGAWNGTVSNIKSINFNGTIDVKGSGLSVINDGNINPTAVRANAGIEPAYIDIKSGGNPPPPPVPTPSTTCSNLLNSTTAVPTNFGASFNWFTSAKELLMNIICSGNADSAASATANIGNGSNTQYIWKTGYVWQNNAWSPFNYSGSNMDSGGNWFIGSANHSLGTIDLTQKQSVLSYICEWTSNTWKCGCHDSACTTGYWNLQQFKQ